MPVSIAEAVVVKDSMLFRICCTVSGWALLSGLQNKDRWQWINSSTSLLVCIQPRFFSSLKINTKPIKSVERLLLTPVGFQSSPVYKKKFLSQAWV